MNNLPEFLDVALYERSGVCLERYSGYVFMNCARCDPSCPVLDEVLASSSTPRKRYHWTLLNGAPEDLPLLGVLGRGQLNQEDWISCSIEVFSSEIAGVIEQFEVQPGMRFCDLQPVNRRLRKMRSRKEYCVPYCEERWRVHSRRAVLPPPICREDRYFGVEFMKEEPQEDLLDYFRLSSVYAVSERLARKIHSAAPSLPFDPILWS